MKVHVDIPQRTSEWMALRVGKLTGSAAKEILAKGRSAGTEAVTRRDLRFRLIAERLSGCSQEDTYVNAAMTWGIEKELEAIAAYEAETGRFVDPITFCEHDTLPVGTSPDGFVGEDGILSVKCPKTATQIRYIREGVEPIEHWAQNTHELWLTGRRWIDFVSYDPRLSDGLRLWMKRVTRTEAELIQYGREVDRFLVDVETEMQAIRAMLNLPQVLKDVAHAV